MKNQPTPPRKSDLDDMKPVNRAAKRALATKKRQYLLIEGGLMPPHFNMYYQPKQNGETNA